MYNAHLQLPAAYRSLSRPSSALGAKAFPLRSLQLDHFFCEIIIGSIFLLENCSNYYLCLNELTFSLILRITLLFLVYLLYSVFKVLGGLKWTRTTDLTLIRRAL